jgi:stage II sporulation protein AA (anti-sigma F factor antagonist)
MVSALHPGRAPKHIAISSRIDSAGVTLVVEGEIDLAAAPTLERELKEAEGSSPRQILLDLAGVGFIDSSGLSLLIRAHERATEAGRTFALTRVPAQARRLFHLTGFEPHVVQPTS